MIDVFPFSGFTVAVLGLGPSGIAAARALSLSGATVRAWDDDAARRDQAANAEDGQFEILDLADNDWSETVSLIVEPSLAPTDDAVHPVVAAAKVADCEVISDVELLARAQRDASYVGVADRNHDGRALEVITHVLSATGQDVEAAGTDDLPALDSWALEAGCTYVLSMPPGRSAHTLSITFDAAVLLDTGSGAWPPYGSIKESKAATNWLFHRQSGPQGAILNLDNPAIAKVFQELKRKKAQIVIGLSTRKKIPGGVYVLNGQLYDDIAGQDVPVCQLSEAEDEAGRRDHLYAAAAYACAAIRDVPPHMAVASLMAFLSV
ncbi:MAG: hypothetical protein HOE62_08835 [Alphaproteobacteria bacterium]|jgi:UDP-N-acetylmuramoylalanine--D-glutamate ligase|nr:hypothetical protein [Alphaproteobacteria bacterium]MBT5160582.1 hypothetical protein [Alphaproteobacteria bacterium]MBT5917963.1 hypothetical protein [Alphaproteobacteria bacterium]